MMGISTNFSFELSLSKVCDQAENLARGDLRLYINGDLIWFQQDEETDSSLGEASKRAVDWTWVDLLAYLAKNWSYLLYEETYPLDLHPETPLELRQLAEDRWRDASLDEDQIFDEDDEVCAFERRHNISSGLNGVYFPSVYIVREGKLAWVCVRDDHGSDTILKHRFKFEVIKEELLRIGNQIAYHLANSMHPRSVRALKAWETAMESSSKNLISIRSGLNSADLKAIEQLAANDADFWELAGADDSEILAAARLSPGSMGIADRKSILELVKAVPFRSTPALDRLSDECLAAMRPYKGERPYLGGYEAAHWLRAKLGIQESESFDPKYWLESWGVSLEYIKTHKDLEALAFWGHKHGPAILINENGVINSKSSGRRTTLAHEICHLLLDRKGSLPFADAIGGSTPEWVEKRARAFAAELLLPRDLIDSVMRGYLFTAEQVGHVDAVDAVEAVISLTASNFDLSANLIVNQLYNSLYSSKRPALGKEVQQKIKNLHFHYSREARLA